MCAASAALSASDDAPRTYAELRRAVEAVFLRGQREVDVAQVMVYWPTGDLIHRHVRICGDRADYGLEIVAQLAADFGASRTAMYRCLQFRRAYEIVSARRQLLWAHYRVLMTIEDRRSRDQLEAAAETEGWNSRQLEVRARPVLQAQKAATVPPAAGVLRPPKIALVPRRGVPGMHRLVPGAQGLALANSAKHKLVGLLAESLRGDGVYVGEVMVVGTVTGTAFDSGHANLDPASIAAKFWELYAARTETYATVH
mgnify:CR=1 FL=1